MGDSSIREGDSDSLRQRLDQFSVIFTTGIIGRCNDHLHARLQILQPHKAANSKLAHQSFDNILNRVDIYGSFIVFTEHAVTDLI